MKIARRVFLSFLSTLPFLNWVSVIACKKKDGQLELTPSCDNGPTPSQTEGPYFTTNSPERSSLLENGVAGTTLILTGQVLDTNCNPVKRALLDWWHADNEGNYDNEGFRLRGHQYTDDFGNFRLTTIKPGVYPGRTRHFHVKVQAPSRPVLTTQLYFPGEPENDRDAIFNPSLLLKVTENGNEVAAGFNFVIRT